jgi:hypothetical protein
MQREREARGLPDWVLDSKTAPKEQLYVAVSERAYSGYAD